MIAVVTALPEELSPLLERASIERVVRVGRRRAHVGTLNGTAVVMMATGVGVAHAEKNLAELLKRFEVTSVIGAGIAGAVASDLKPGDVIGDLPGARRARIQTVEKITRDKRVIDADAIDMESSGWQRAADRFAVPLSVARVIFDAADEEIPAFVAGDGTVDRRAILR